MNGVRNDHVPNGINGHTERKLGVYDDVHMDPKLTPKKYQIKGNNSIASLECVQARSPVCRDETRFQDLVHRCEHTGLDWS